MFDILPSIVHSQLFKAWKEKKNIFKMKTKHTIPSRVANCALWFLKLPHSEAKEQVICNVNILRGYSSMLELLETIGNLNPKVIRNDCQVS
jgi:hypothetical protein